jgi:WD40 repeat protein
LRRTAMTTSHSRCETAYSAGAVVVIYNHMVQRQTHFLLSPSSRPIQCVAYSCSGAVIAAGEGGHNPSVLVWDVASAALKARLNAHKAALAVVCFSPDEQLLVSCGERIDGAIVLWDWRTQMRLAMTRVSIGVSDLIFIGANFFLTVGPKHAKTWSVPPTRTTRTHALDGKIYGPAQLREANIVSAEFDECSGRLMLCKSCGSVCIMNKLVHEICSWSSPQVSFTCATNMSINVVMYIAVGRADGAVQLLQLLDASDGYHLKPMALIDSYVPHSIVSCKFCVSGSIHCLVAVYNERTVCTW